MFLALLLGIRKNKVIGSIHKPVIWAILCTKGKYKDYQPYDSTGNKKE